jgi:hypothetical protein
VSTAKVIDVSEERYASFFMVLEGFILKLKALFSSKSSVVFTGILRNIPHNFELIWLSSEKLKPTILIKGSYETRRSGI